MEAEENRGCAENPKEKYKRELEQYLMRVRT